MKKRLLQLFYILLPAGVLLFLISGCLWQKSYVAVKYYDLDTPHRIVLKKVQLKFMPLDSTESVKYKMVYRDANGQMLVDDYNKWIQPPSLLLTRYLQSAFKQDDVICGLQEIIISGNIFMFRIDLQKNIASLGVNYVIKTSCNDTVQAVFKNSTVFSSKFEKRGSQYFVKALSECAGKLVLAIEKDIKKIQVYRLSEEKKAVKTSKK